MTHPKTITVGQLRSDLTELLKLPDNAEVYFGAGDLSYYRPKDRSSLDPKEPRLIQIEFNELYEVTLDPHSDS